MLRKLKDVAVVTLNRMDVPEFSSVATDHYACGRMAVDLFYAKGHRKMALLCEERENWGARQRSQAFLDRTKELGLAVDEQFIAYTDHQPMYGQIRRLLSLGPTAIFVAEENLGIEALYILKEVMNVRVPEDVSLMGMELSQVSQFLSPPLTAIMQPLPELSTAALDMLLKHITEGSRKPVQLMLENRLIERESVATRSVEEKSAKK
jgi:DNA-binding LacI/PurR family transcriptional regulator